MSAVVTVWPVPLRAATAADHAVLDAAERDRAAALRRGAGTFVVVRATLRRLLGAALGRAPADVVLAVEPGGRPVLAGGGPHFSVSHADGLGAIALAADVPVGVDVERVRPDRRAAAARALGLGDAGTEDVFAAWCATEAVAKAAGCGLPAALRGDVPAVEGGWHARPLAIDARFAAAVAAPGHDWTVRMEEIAA